MARGDVVVLSAGVAAGTYLTYQPAGGVEALITHCGSSLQVEGLPAINIAVVDATLLAYTTLAAEPALFTNVRQSVKVFKLFVNNTHYLKIRNLDTDGEAQIFYSGIQTK